MVEGIEVRLKELLIEKATELGVEIETMEIMPDHVHVFVKTQPNDAPQFLIGQLKGYTLRIIREEFPELKSKLPTLWTRSYYCESVGHISEDAIKKYIEEQKNK